MSNLKKKKLELDLMKVAAAKAELEYKIEERLEDIQRMKDHIKLQEDREIELIKELEELNGK
jgi:SMC interacting uncharacterized protein involved in chromosome segregation